MSAFRAGNNEDYIEHIISMLCLLDQKGTKTDILKAFKVVKEATKKLEPLATALPSDATKAEKEERKPKTADYHRYGGLAKGEGRGRHRNHEGL